MATCQNMLWKAKNRKNGIGLETIFFFRLSFSLRSLCMASLFLKRYTLKRFICFTFECLCGTMSLVVWIAHSIESAGRRFSLSLVLACLSLVAWYSSRLSQLRVWQFTEDDGCLHGPCCRIFVTVAVHCTHKTLCYGNCAQWSFPLQLSPFFFFVSATAYSVGSQEKHWGQQSASGAASWRTQNSSPCARSVMSRRRYWWTCHWESSLSRIWL